MLPHALAGHKTISARSCRFPYWLHHESQQPCTLTWEISKAGRCYHPALIAPYLVRPACADMAHTLGIHGARGVVFGLRAPGTCNPPTGAHCPAASCKPCCGAYRLSIPACEGYHMGSACFELRKIVRIERPLSLGGVVQI